MEVKHVFKAEQDIKKFFAESEKDVRDARWRAVEQIDKAKLNDFMQRVMKDVKNQQK